MKKSIRFENLSPEILSCVLEVCGELGISVSNDANVTVSVVAGECLALKKEGDTVVLTYSRKNEIFRGLTRLPSVIDSGAEISEKAKYSLLSYMADVSRNAVFNIPTAKKMIRYLAMMGYNSMMLYTEDTYEMPEYKYFGHMRGRYSEAELRELDDYAYSFGIELIPCIQTLAHMWTAMRWPDFEGYKDNDDILLVGDERTYRFIRAALSQCKKCFRTNRINIGMDEAHGIACGAYLKKNGYRKPSDVMLEHLDKVAEICRELGLKPMMWSDMFFRMAFNGRYYVREGDVPREVAEKIPADVEQVYWDYYSLDHQRLDHMMSCHKKFKSKTVFAGGAWKWGGFGTCNALSMRSSKIALDVCEEYGVGDVIVTGWGDDGGEASQFSALSTLIYFAERCYGDEPDADHLDSRARECFDTSFDTLLYFDLPNSVPETDIEIYPNPTTGGKYLLFNDPLERIMDCHMSKETVAAAYADNAKKLSAVYDNEKFGHAFRSLGALCDLLSMKADLGWRLYDAYQAGDRETLKKISDEIPVICEKLRVFIDTFRAQWYLENKSFGFSAQEQRLGGLMERLSSTKRRVDSYLAGETHMIDELEYAPLPVRPERDGQYIDYNNWCKTVRAGLL